MTKMQNPFIWYDLMTPDVEGAKKFYSEVVGWNFIAQMPTYNVASVGKIGVGGIMETPAELKSKVQSILAAITPEQAKTMLPNRYTGFVSGNHATYAPIEKAGVAVGKIKAKS